MCTEMDEFSIKEESPTGADFDMDSFLAEDEAVAAGETEAAEAEALPAADLFGEEEPAKRKEKPHKRDKNKHKRRRREKESAEDSGSMSSDSVQGPAGSSRPSGPSAPSGPGKGGSELKRKNPELGDFSTCSCCQITSKEAGRSSWRFWEFGAFQGEELSR